MKAPEDISTVRGGEFRLRGDIARLLPPGAIGIELGVASGGFSARLLASPNLLHLYSVDMWSGDRGHGVEEYKSAIRALMPFRDRNTCLRMTFDEALDLFPDEHFDLVYVDGYAHTGQQDGKTLATWWPKVKPGGVFSGDDYSQRWPRVMEEVDKFVHARSLPLYLLTPQVREDAFSRHPSWIAFKPVQGRQA
jgi:Methyltransferase domain